MRTGRFDYFLRLVDWYYKNNLNIWLTGNSAKTRENKKILKRGFLQSCSLQEKGFFKISDFSNKYTHIQTFAFCNIISMVVVAVVQCCIACMHQVNLFI